MRNAGKILLFTLAGALPFTAAAQLDTLVRAQGKIVNAETKEPIQARITYQSLPYGSKMGILNGTTYAFPLFDNSPYSITVVAPGYATSKYMIDPSEANGDRLIIKDIELSNAASTTEGQNAVGSVLRLTSLIFEQGRSKISGESFPELDRLADLLVNNRRMVIQLEGHTDYQGNASKNLKLSEQRVNAVQDYLVDKGAHKSQVKTKAFGGTQPLSREDTPEAHSMNRRVEVRILAN